MPLIPVKLSKVYPPKPPEPQGSALNKIVFTKGLVYIDDSKMAEPDRVGKEIIKSLRTQGLLPHACADHEPEKEEDGEEDEEEEEEEEEEDLEEVEYSLEDPADLAKFMKTADIRFVRAEYFWQLFNQNKVPPARRQELEEDRENVIKKDDGTYASPLVFHEEVEAWASGDEEALLCSISHCFESMEHPDPLGDQTRRVASATALYAAAYGAQVWVFMDFLSIYQYEQTPEQRKSFELAMQNMHLMYSHESTMTFRLEHLTPPEKNSEALKDKSNTVKIWHKPTKEVKHVPISDLTWNNRDYHRRGWCRLEDSWSRTRSTVSSNQKIDSHLNSDETNQFKCQVAEAPDQFRLECEKIEFHRDSDRKIILALQKKVFLQKAGMCEHLVVENVDATQIAILADSITHYNVLKCLTLKHFLCREPEAKRLWEVLAKMKNLERVRYLEPGDDESLRVIKKASKSCKGKVSFGEGLEGTPRWRDKRRQPEPKIPRLLELLQCGEKVEELDLQRYSADQQRKVLRALTRSIMVKKVFLSELCCGELEKLLGSATSVQYIELKVKTKRKEEDEENEEKYEELRKQNEEKFEELRKRLSKQNQALWKFEKSESPHQLVIKRTK